ncbi:MAG: hypothetical protein AAF633_16640 [Chloroflexota bacterium]
MKKPVELLKLMKIPPDGRLTVEVRGRRFDQLNEIPDPRVRSVLQHAIRSLLEDVCDAEDLDQIGFQKKEPVSEGDTGSTVESADLKSEPLNQRSIDDTSDDASGPVDEAKRAAFLASLEQNRSQSPSNPERSGSLLSRFRSRPKEIESVQAPRLPVLNIAGQIHQLVQEEKSKFPELAQREITIQQSVDSGLRIIVDSNVYQDVAEIDDPQIRMVIKNAIRAWENLN